MEWKTNDVLQRKYQHSWVVFEDEQGTLSSHWVNECHWNGSQPIFFEGPNVLANHLPVYYPIESGYYTSPKEEPYLLVILFSPEKNFKVGVSPDGWILNKVNTGSGNLSDCGIGPGTKLDLLNPPDRTKFLIRGIGIISRNYLISTNKIFFKGNQIGLKHENKIILDQDIFRKDLSSLLGCQWQIS